MEEHSCGMTFEESKAFVRNMTIETFSEALKRKEGIIEQGLRSAAQAFEDIRNYKLYKEDYPGYTFEQYCRERWKVNRQAINHLIRAKQIRKENGRLNDQNISDTALGQHIARLPKSKQSKVIKQVTANGNSPTVKEVKKAVDNELGIVRRKPSISKELKDYLNTTGTCPVCGHHN